MAMRCSHIGLLLLSLLLAKTLNSTAGFPNPFNNKDAAALPPIEMPDIELPDVMGEEDDETMTDILAETASTVTVLYGTALLLYGKYFPEQILVLTMMRATGFATIETAILTARRNFRRAARFAIWRAPSFLKARNSILHIHDRIDDAKRAMEATRKAKEDGVITKHEERELKLMHKRDIRRLRRDRQRIQRGMVNLGKFIQVLDLVEIFDIIKSFIFQMIAVLAAGHSNSKLCIVISSWCHFLSLGSLLLDASQKVINSIAERPSFLDRIHKHGKRSIGFLGKTAIVFFAFYLVFSHRDFANRLNAALLEAAIILHGLRYFVDSVWDRDEDIFWASAAKQLEKTGGGLLILFLATLSLYFVDLDKLWTPRFLFITMEAIEKGIETLVDNLL